MQKLRKALVVSVGAITILSMSMFMVPLQVGAAAQAGDLIKMNGLSSVYYLAADGKRYVFPNESTYFSWYSDFSKVVTIPQAELEGYPLGKNVTVRPGTKLVKITTNPKVYAVTTGGTLLAVPDEATAKALWGDNWNKRIIDVPDGFFTNYTIGSATVSATAYPAGSIVKFGTAADVYYIAADGKAQKVATEAAFLANGFSWNNVVTSTLAKPTAGADITAKDATITDTSAGAGGTVYTGGSGLTVALSGDTPTSMTVPSGAALVPFFRFNLTAAADGAVTVSDIVLTRIGTGLTTDLSGGYLYEGDTRLTTLRSVNSSDHTITFNALGYTVPAGSTKTLTLKINAATGDKTGNHAFKIGAASAVVTNGATVSGSFPVTGNTMSLSSVDAGGVTLTATDDLGDPKVGETNVKVGEFDIENTSATEDINIYSIKLKNDGTASNDAIKNFSLDLDGTIVKSGVSMVDKYVTFTLDTPFFLKKSKKISAAVRGDISTDVNKTFQLYLNNIADFDARGSAYGDFYSAVVTNTSLTSTAADDITIKGAAINVSFDGPDAQEIKDDNDNMVLANFKIMATSEDVNFDDLLVRVTNGTDDATDILDNVEMVDTTNNISYSVADETTYDTSPYNEYDFQNVLLKKGVQYNFQIRGDVPDNGTTGQTYVAYINFSDGTTNADYVQSDAAVTMATDISSVTLTGKTMTIAAPTVTMDRVLTSAASYVENTDKVLLFKGKITANGVSDLKVSKVSVEPTFGTIDSVDDAFEKVYLYLATDDLGTPLDTETSLAIGATTALTFSGFNLTVPKGASNGIIFVVRGDVKNDPTEGTMSLHWKGGATTTDFIVRDDNNDSLTATQYLTNAYEAAGQVSTVTGNGTFTMAFDNDYTGVNANKNVLAGSRVLVGRLKVDASNEAVKLEDFTLINQRGSGTSDDVAYVKLFSDAAMTQQLGSASFDASRRAFFDNVNINVPVSGITYIYVGADLKGIDYSSSPTADATGNAERTVKLDIASSTSYTVIAKGVSTGNTLANFGVSSTTATYTSTILGATMSNITSDFANGLLSNGTAKDLFSFKVTAPASTNVDYDGQALGINLKTVIFTFATSSGVNASAFKIQRVGGANGEITARDANGAALTNCAGTLTVDFNSSYATGTQTDLIVRPGETATFVLRGTIAGVDTSDSLQTTLESIDSNDTYAHHTGTTGTQGSDITAVYPLLTGITSVRAGSLTN